MSLVVEYASTAQCRPEHVWQVFEQIERWPRWDPQAIREVRWISGAPWSKGAKFTIEMLKPLSFKLTPEVREVDPPIYVHLHGKGSGITGAQHYIFKWMPDRQATEVRTLQEFSGAPIKLLGNSIKGSIEAGIRHLFARVIEEAEQIARTSTTSTVSGFSSAPASTSNSATSASAQAIADADPLSNSIADTIADTPPKPANFSPHIRPPAGEPEPPDPEPRPPAGDPAPPTVDSEPPVGDPAPQPRDPEPPSGEPVPPVGDPTPPDPSVID